MKYNLKLFGATDSVGMHLNEPKVVRMHANGGYKNSVICAMALVKYGEFIVAMSGKAGGTINSNNRGGKYAKNWARPVNRNTIYQIGARNTQTRFAQLWRTLTAAQRAAWIAAAPTFPYVNRVGDTVFLSGFNLYCKLNINLALVGVTPLTTPPAAGGVTTVLTLTATEIAGVTTLTFTPTPIPAGTNFLVWATPGLSAGVNYVKNQYRLIGFFAAAVTSPQVITTIYNARFGAPVIGSKIFYGLQPINIVTGQTGLMLNTSVIAA
jgi:hypothetical protein